MWREKFGVRELPIDSISFRVKQNVKSKSNLLELWQNV